MFSQSIDTIILDPGHGGKDPGAIGANYLEKDINLSLALNLKISLNNIVPSLNVVLTRKDDTFIALKDRSQLTKKYPCSIFISLHANSCNIPTVNGYEIYYYHNNESKNLASTLLTSISKTFPDLRNRGIKKGNLYVLKNSSVPAVLIETGFISNKKEEQLISSSSFISQLSDCLATSIYQYIF